MPVWFSKLRHEWALLSAAPLSLAVAVIVPAAVTWAAVDLFYSSALAGRNAEIVQLNARISAYRDALGGADPKQAAADMLALRAQTAASRKQLAELQSPDREPNAIYQNGQRIGIVDGAEIDAAGKSVGFQRMTIDRELDQATNVEFRDLVMSFKGYAAVTRTGQSAGAIYHAPRFAVVGHRGEGCTSPPAPDTAKE